MRLWCFTVGIILGFFVGSAPVSARDNGQWSDSPSTNRQWFKHLMQPDNPTVSCCGEADAFEADEFDREGDHYVAIITGGRGEFPNGMRVSIPNSKMKWSDGNPTGHGILFMGPEDEDGSRAIYCYVPPGGV